MEENTSLTPQEIAELLKITKNTVYELIKRGELNGYRVGKKLRVDLADVETYKNRTRKHGPLPAPSPEPPYEDWESPYLSGGAAAGFVICGQDIMLDILARHLEQKVEGLRILRSYIGSYNGLYALYHGSVQVATAHLWDAGTDSYNIPYIRSLLPGTPTVVYHLADRMEGFYVAKGNPKNIRSWEDLKRRDLTLVNRERGSGARILLDEHLRLLGVAGQSIPGYGRECSSHLTVASTVARGGADLGVGIEKAAMQAEGVDFIPLQAEQYDLVFKKEDAAYPAFEAIVSVLRSREFALEISGLGGYDLTDLGKLTAET